MRWRAASSRATFSSSPTRLVSKAEGRRPRLAEVVPSQRALELAAAHNKDPRHVQVVLDESRELLRARDGTLICVTHHGFVCANAGVDASNAPEAETVIMLPRDPDGSARRIASSTETTDRGRAGIVITDSFGRAWRRGQSDIAIGCAGLAALEDWRGPDRIRGRVMHATMIAVADQLAGGRGPGAGQGRDPARDPRRGAGRWVTAEDGPGSRRCCASPSDLFR